MLRLQSSKQEDSCFPVPFLLSPILSVLSSGHYKSPGDGKTPFSFYPEQLAVELSFRPTHAAEVLA